MDTPIAPEPKNARAEDISDEMLTFIEEVKSMRLILDTNPMPLAEFIKTCAPETALYNRTCHVTAERERLEKINQAQRKLDAENERKKKVPKTEQQVLRVFQRKAGRGNQDALIPMPPSYFVKECMSGSIFGTNIAVANTEILARDYEDTQRRKYRDVELKQKMQKRKQQNLLEARELRLVKKAKMSVRGIRNMEEAEEFDSSLPGPSTM
eukprot:NP_510615.2 Uncharacterized protein CELE_E03G2.1 [Caenorhabditis elegans]